MDLKTANATKDVLISDLTVQSKVLEAQRDEYQSSLNAWYHNPFVLFSIGLVVGGVGGLWASKH